MTPACSSDKKAFACIECLLIASLFSNMATSATYGSWVSPITSDVVVKESISLKDVRVDPFQEDKIFWSEIRPEEDGRYVICCWTEGQKDFESLTPENFSSRTTVHEYGGGAFFVHKYRIYFSNFKDQRLYYQKLKKLGSEPIPMTPKGKDWRYADGTLYKKHIVVCVREDHEVISEDVKEAENTLVSISRKTQEQSVLVSGASFYSTPRVSKHGTLAWVQWNHPNMPWDSTELWIGQLSPDGQSLKDGTKRKIAGGEGISVMLPKWSPDDKLMYIHDKTNWWNLYKLDDKDKEISICPQDAEIGGPAWEFGASPYSCNPDGNGEMLLIHGPKLTRITHSGEQHEIKLDTDYKSLSKMYYTPNGKHVYLVAGSPTMFTKLIKLDVKSGKTSIIRTTHTADIDTGYYSIPTEITWNTTQDAKAHGYYYPPQNKDYQGPEGEHPPLLVKVHGGPTGSCSPSLDLKKQFFTSRGFAVLDVNYRGSTGYGTEYRNALKKNWGLLDIEDCCTGAQSLADEGKVDRSKLFIDGGSAGGFAALAAITFHNVFSAGTSFFGVCDLTALAADTHKFESRYLDTLIGPLPEAQDVYDARSPIKHTDKLDCALCIFQGLEDKVVPPEQSQMMYDGAYEKGNPVAYKTFEGEQHGFRQAKNIKFSLDGEFYFYSRVFKFDAPGIDVDLKIENLPEDENN